MKRFLTAVAGWLLILGIFVVPATISWAQQSFSCPYATRAACLDYGDQVCPSDAKCVDEAAQCFGPYTCNYQGFVCKSDLSDAISEYNDLLTKHRSLVNEYNELAMQHDSNIDDYNQLLSAYEDLNDCIGRADSLNEAKACQW